MNETMKKNLEAMKETFQNVHAVCGMKLNPMQAAMATEAQQEKPCKVDFKLLCELLNENPCMDFGEIIGMLDMSDIPMTDAFRKLGICAGVLYA